MRWRALPALGWAGGIFSLSAQESLPVILPFSFADKLEHAAAYGILCLLIVYAFASLERKHLVLAALFASAYGGSDEIHQIFVPGRSPDVLDWIADTVGAILVVGALWLWRQRRDQAV